MKILHTADIHIGVKNSRLPKDKQSLLKDESIYNIRNFFENAKKDRYDVILICGDLFHSKTITSKFSKMFFSCVEDFGNPVVYVSGNHDKNYIFPLDLPKNFVLLCKNNPIFTFGEYNFYCGNLNEDFKLNLQKNNILLLHGNIENTRDSDYIDINKFLNKGFDYIAMGHVHQYKTYKLNNDILAYPGCLFSSGFDEHGMKGYISLEIEGKTIKKLQYVPFATRKFVVCECDISNAMTNKEIINRIENSLTCVGANYEDLIKITLKGALSEECEKSISFIKSKFDNYFYFEIEDKTTLKIDIQKVKNEKLSFKYEFISLVEDSQLDEEDKRIICEIGLEALKGEDLNI